MSIHEKLLLKENLIYAWKKAKKMYSFSDGYVDRAEMAEFELNLENELFEINKKFKSGTYKCSPLRALSRPKKIENGSEVNRQYFHVSIRDQVAWIAIINAIGPELDLQMPPWSYGNRLYRPAWYEEAGGVRSTLEVGPYRHASGHLYKKFQHSWPLFRRHIALTARNMVSPISVEDVADDSEVSALIAGYKEKLPYLVRDFWKGCNVENSNKLFHASIDIRQFFPNISAKSILNSLSKFLVGFDDDKKFRRLVEGMLSFTLSDDFLSDDVRSSTVPPYKEGKIDGIPTGLFVSGFLSNVALLSIDKEVHSKVVHSKKIAHFRFVDDHTFISYSFDDLCEWIKAYKEILSESNEALVINEEKYDPESLSQYLNGIDKNFDKSIAIKACEIDGKNPTKLLTKTLGQVSIIANTNIETLDDVELEARLGQLEWLLLADIPDREIRSDTRAAFAAGQIASLAFLLLQESDYSALSLKKITVINENKRINACFNMLMTAFRENPCKARLFYRLVDYCYLTGFQGLSHVSKWIIEERACGRDYWAGYYTSVLLNILSVTLLRSIKCLLSDNTLWASRYAAVAHIYDIANLNPKSLLASRGGEFWFSLKAKNEFSVSLTSAIKFLEVRNADLALITKMQLLKSYLSPISLESLSHDWKKHVGYKAGVWAFWVESIVKINDSCSVFWPLFEKAFDYSSSSDLSAARLYPEAMSAAGFSVAVNRSDGFKKSDACLIKEIIRYNPSLLEVVKESENSSLRLAARNLMDKNHSHISLASWVDFIKGIDYFDPRKGEWTCLQIIKIVLKSMLSIDSKIDIRDLHPENIFIPVIWEKYQEGSDSILLGWEAWRKFSNENNEFFFIKKSLSILDYRYVQNEVKLAGGELMGEKLRAFGLILLGLLRESFAMPKIYNVRGNEYAIDFPTPSLISHLAVSSPTLEILRSCLTSRSNENRSICRQPEFYGIKQGELPNDIQFDPPVLNDPNSLLARIESAQRILEKNQVSVSMHQPRQMIPVKIQKLLVVMDDEDQGV